MIVHFCHVKQLIQKTGNSLKYLFLINLNVLIKHVLITNYLIANCLKVLFNLQKPFGIILHEVTLFSWEIFSCDHFYILDKILNLSFFFSKPQKLI